MPENKRYISVLLSEEHKMPFSPHLLHICNVLLLFVYKKKQIYLKKKTNSLAMYSFEEKKILTYPDIFRLDTVAHNFFWGGGANPRKTVECTFSLNFLP